MVLHARDLYQSFSPLFLPFSFAIFHSHPAYLLFKDNESPCYIYVSFIFIFHIFLQLKYYIFIIYNQSNGCIELLSETSGFSMISSIPLGYVIHDLGSKKKAIVEDRC